MTIKYQITADPVSGSTITFYDHRSGNFYTVSDKQGNYRSVRDAVLDGDLALAVARASVVTDIVERLARVDSRFTVAGNNIAFDGRPLSLRLSTFITGVAGSREDLLPVVRFLHYLNQNPSNHSVEQLFDWMDYAGLTIDNDGFIVAYKGIRDGYSISSGTAFVNGVKHTGRIPNRVGDTITMPRNQVADDPGHACSTGLHAGTHAYASSFGPTLVTVRINPANVVSVPADCDAQKMRVSEYEVVAVNERKQEYRGNSIIQSYDEYVDDLPDEDDYHGSW